MAQKGVLTTSDYLPKEEYDRLLICLHDDGLYVWEAYSILAYFSALRISDCRTTRWGDIIGTDEFHKIEKKTKKTRKIRINQSVRAKINPVYELLGSPDKETYILQNPKTNQPYSTRHVNRMLKWFKFRYRLKIKSFSTHSFRKTFGRQMWEKRGKTDEALYLLGDVFNHSNIGTTKRYLGFRQEEIASVYDDIEI